MIMISNTIPDFKYLEKINENMANGHIQYGWKKDVASLTMLPLCNVQMKIIFRFSINLIQNNSRKSEKIKKKIKNLNFRQKRNFNLLKNLNFLFTARDRFKSSKCHPSPHHQFGASQAPIPSIFALIVNLNDHFTTFCTVAERKRDFPPFFPTNPHINCTLGKIWSNGMGESDDDNKMWGRIFGCRFPHCTIPHPFPWSSPFILLQVVQAAA